MAELHAKSSEPQRKRLLCVDDDPETLKVRRLLFETSGYFVVTAESGEAALEILAAGPAVDLVLLDYLMPGMNGDELANRLRQRFPSLPLIAVSAVGRLPESLLNTVDATIQKGQDPEVLLSTVAALLARAELEKNRRFASRKSVLCVEDEELQLKLRKLLFEAAGYLVHPARSAALAMEAFRAHHVDAVIMDYWLSGQNGTLVAEEMKRLRPKIPIVMLSGFAPLPGEGAVVDSWLRKAEIEPQDLVNEVNRLIELRGSNQRELTAD